MTEGNKSDEGRKDLTAKCAIIAKEIQIYYWLLN
jgi:hypothetical protein